MGRHLKQLKLQNIEITDSLFGAYVKRVKEKIIPHQWKILNDELEDGEPTYCIQNFRIAAGIENGSRRGVVFQDTDLYKLSWRLSSFTGLPESGNILKRRGIL